MKVFGVFGHRSIEKEEKDRIRNETKIKFELENKDKDVKEYIKLETIRKAVKEKESILIEKMKKPAFEAVDFAIKEGCTHCSTTGDRGWAELIARECIKVEIPINLRIADIFFPRKRMWLFRYANVKRRGGSITREGKEYRTYHYTARNLRVVDESDIFGVYYDGREGGATVNTIRKAIRRGVIIKNFCEDKGVNEKLKELIVTTMEKMESKV